MDNVCVNWKIFIVTHGPIVDKYYMNDCLFSNNHFSFFNVSDDNLTHSDFIIVNKNSVDGFVKKGKWYAESEVLYNIFLSGIYKQYDFIGFIHWDYELCCIDDKVKFDITRTIEERISQGHKFISFSSYDVTDIYNQKIMMDRRYPNQKIGNGINCLDVILSDYNKFFSTNVDFNMIKNRRMNLCSAFLCDVTVFENLMGFYTSIIEKGEIDLYDLNHRYRFQGGLLERYIGVYSSMIDFSEIELKHHYNHAKETAHFPYLMGRFNLFKYKLKLLFFNLRLKFIKH